MYVEIVSAEQAIFSGKVKQISVTGNMGELGILPGHAPLLTTLLPGLVYLETEDNQEEAIFVSGGIIEVQPTEVTILADTVERVSEADEEKILAARRLAEDNAAKALGGAHECDYAAIKQELARTAGLLKVLQKLRKPK